MKTNQNAAMWLNMWSSNETGVISTTHGTAFCSLIIPFGCQPDVMTPPPISNRTLLYKSLILIRPIGCAFSRNPRGHRVNVDFSPPRRAHPFHPPHGTLLICDITGFTARAALNHHFQLDCNHGQPHLFPVRPHWRPCCVRLGDQVHFFYNFAKDKFTVFNRKSYRLGTGGIFTRQVIDIAAQMPTHFGSYETT